MTDKTGILVIKLGNAERCDQAGDAELSARLLRDGRVIDKPWSPRQLLVRDIVHFICTYSSAKCLAQMDGH